MTGSTTPTLTDEESEMLAELSDDDDQLRLDDPDRFAHLEAS